MRLWTAFVTVVAVAACVAVMAQGAPSHLMRYADVHGDQIVFTYEGDLWLVSTAGGDARRVTSDPGEERCAKFSPDGRWIAFTGSYDGGVDVYLMPAEGGVPKRLTWHPSPDNVVGWTPDGKDILFRSRREFPFRGEELYEVPAAGGTEKKLPIDRCGLASLSPDGSMIAYNRLSTEGATWKRHQGGDAQEIWMGSLAKGDFHVVAPWKGIDNYPMWWGDGIYFTSDREAGTLNIFRYDVKTGEVRALTHYTDYDVKYPSLGDGRIVFQNGETLHLLDLKTEKVRDLAVRMPSDRVLVRDEYESSTDHTGVFGLCPQGKALVLESRGEILVVPAEKDDGPGWNLTRSSGSHDKDPAWSPDGKKVAFISDRTGEEELYLADPKGDAPWKQLTSGNKGYRFRPVWSPDSKCLLFGDKSMRLNLLDVATGALSVVDQGDYDDGWERWGIQDYVWSPDSRWIAYTKKMENTNEVVFLYSMDQKKSYAVTGDSSQSWSPSFDPKGRYLFFLSNRTYHPIMGTLDQTDVFLDMTRPYLVVLKKGAASPFSAEGRTEGKADEEKPAAAEKGKPAAPPASSVDVGDFEARTVPVEGVEAGTYFCLEAVEGGFFYLARTKPVFSKYDFVTDVTSEELTLFKYDLKDKKPSEFMGGVNSYHVSADGKKLAYRAGKRFGIVDCAGQAKAGEGAVDLAAVTIKVNRMEEFPQIFDEAWRIERDWYCDPGMQGNDWKAIGEQYRKFVPDCGNRSDLNYLIGEMIAELNTGHTYVGGGDLNRDGKRVGVGLLGCVFEDGAAYPRITHVISGKPWDDELRSPLAEPGCPIREGDYLIAVDGQKVQADRNLYSLFENKAGVTVTLTYNTKPSEEGARTWRTKTLRNENAIRYQEWVDGRAAYVAKASGGKLGYIHLPDMQEEGLIAFAKGFFPQLGKKAMVIDARYNGGGFTSGMIIDRLERTVWSATQPREGKPCLNPEAAFWGPYAVIVNEDTGSDGEIFTQAIKIKKLAKVFGMRTWGGAFGIEPHQFLVDGGTVTPPGYGLYSLDRKFLIEGRGVDPDVEVQNMPADALAGKDPQLDAAVQYLMERVRQEPKEIPAAPPYPNKAKPHGSDASGM
jgi:tricorn protease